MATTKSKMQIKPPNKICILDIETERTVFKAPEKSKLAFVGIKEYTLHHERYFPCKHRWYLPEHSSKLELFLKNYSGIIIGHNILQFDYRVLRPLISLDGIVDKTVDTLVFLYKKNGKKFKGLSLNNICSVNFGKCKTIKGKFISELWRKGKKKEVIKYNENDCILTKTLWCHLVNGRSLKVPTLRPKYPNNSSYEKFCLKSKFFQALDGKPVYNYSEAKKTLNVSSHDFKYLIAKKSLFTFKDWENKIDRDGYILEKQERKYYLDKNAFDMSGFIPFNQCPKCGSENLEKHDELEKWGEHMSEGQLAEYVAGTWGSVFCLDCGWSDDYEI
jgi:predicted nucleic-acid-binding Zn-ribbon protein